MRQLEVGCGWCGRWHKVKTLAAVLFCCSVRSGVRRLIVEVEDPKTGARWFQITNTTEVRVIVREGKKRNGHGPQRAPKGRG